jgi:hypothetical protein
LDTLEGNDSIENVSGTRRSLLTASIQIVCWM